MTLAVALFGGFIAALGAAGIASPERLLELVTRAQSRLGLLGIAALRLLVALALLGAADSSHAPRYLHTLAALALLSALVTPLVGQRRFDAVLAWWRRQGRGAVRAWSLLVLVFGLSLVLSVLPRQPAG